MSTEQPVQTLAVFILEDGKAAKAFLKVVQKIDDADKTVKIVDAAIADKSGKGKVKIHQTEETSGLKGGLRGAAIGLVVGAIVVAGTPLAWGAAAGILAGLHNRFRDIGIDDKFMQRTAAEIEAGRSALFVLYEGDWSHSIGAIEDAIRANGALLIQSTLPPEAAAELRALVEPAAEELGGEEVVADFEVETEPAPEEAAAAAEPAPVIAEAEPDDLTKVSGIGPKASDVLVAAGIASYHDLAGTSEPALRGVFSDAHTAVPRSVGTWAMQASFAERGDWAGLKAFNGQTQPAAQDRRQGGPRARRPDQPRGHRAQGGQGARGGWHQHLCRARRGGRADPAQGAPRRGHDGTLERGHLADAGGLRPPGRLAGTRPLQRQGQQGRRTPGQGRTSGSRPRRGRRQARRPDPAGGHRAAHREPPRRRWRVRL